MASAGLGVGIALLFGILAFVVLIFLCCRRRRLFRADLDIAKTEAIDSAGGGRMRCPLLLQAVPFIGGP